MGDEKRKLFEETVKNLEQLDLESLMIIKSGSEMLRARDVFDKEGKKQQKKIYEQKPIM